MTEQYKPEIGEYCEVFLESEVLGDRWAKVKCVGHDANGIIWRNGSDTLSYRYASLDTIREHKSECEKFKEVLTEIFDKDHHIYHNLNTSDYMAVSTILWDNGYRKIEE